jgi:hypothetical protein
VKTEIQKETDMKMTFVICAVLGLTAGSAMAECTYHSATLTVPESQRQASVDPAEATPPDQAMLNAPPKTDGGNGTATE